MVERLEVRDNEAARSQASLDDARRELEETRDHLEEARRDASRSAAEIESREAAARAEAESRVAAALEEAESRETAVRVEAEARERAVREQVEARAVAARAELEAQAIEARSELEDLKARWSVLVTANRTLETEMSERDRTIETLESRLGEHRGVLDEARSRLTAAVQSATGPGQTRGWS